MFFKEKIQHFNQQRICISKLGHHWFRKRMLPDQHRDITWTNADALSIEHRNKFSKIWIKENNFDTTKLFKNAVSNIAPIYFFLGLNVLRVNNLLFWV